MTQNSNNIAKTKYFTYSKFNTYLYEITLSNVETYISAVTSQANTNNKKF